VEEVHQATRARVQADAELAAARTATVTTREAAVAALDASKKPGRAPRSPASLWLLGVLLLQFEWPLTDAEMQAVTGYTVNLAERCGAAKIIAGRERDRIEADRANSTSRRLTNSLANPTLLPVGAAG
jgi:hypothetical protein